MHRSCLHTVIVLELAHDVPSLVNCPIPQPPVKFPQLDSFREHCMENLLEKSTCHDSNPLDALAKNVIFMMIGQSCAPTMLGRYYDLAQPLSFGVSRSLSTSIFLTLCPCRRWNRVDLTLGTQTLQLCKHALFPGLFGTGEKMGIGRCSGKLMRFLDYRWYTASNWNMVCIAGSRP